MVKLKAIYSDSNNYRRKTNIEIEKVFRKANQKLVPIQKAHEFRDINVVKFDKVFSKPYFCYLNQPRDWIKVIAKSNNSLWKSVNDGFDVQLIIWDPPSRKPIFNIKTPRNMIKCLTYSDNWEDIITSRDDNMNKFYN